MALLPVPREGACRWGLIVHSPQDRAPPSSTCGAQAFQAAGPAYEGLLGMGCRRCRGEVHRRSKAREGHWALCWEEGWACQEGFAGRQDLRSQKDKELGLRSCGSLS